MIRPSALQMAELCGLSPALSAQFPESSQHAARGTAIHTGIVEAIKNGTASTHPEVAAAVAWVDERFPDAELLTEHPLILHDHDGDEVITQGTADLVVQLPGGVVWVVDWKSGRRENVPPASDSLQLAAYAIAAGTELAGTEAVGWSNVFLDGDTGTEDAAPQILSEDWWPWIARITAASRREPVATPGPHCGSCYQRHHCPTWRGLAATAITTLGTGTEIALTDETAAEMALRRDMVSKALDIADDLLKNYVRGGGSIVAGGKEWRPSMVKGRETADVKAIKDAGLTQYLKTGQPYERWGWGKVKP